MSNVATCQRDAQLVEQVLGGSAAAFADLYRTHLAAVTLVVRNTLSDPDARADVVQEAFAKAFERLPSLREADRFRPWLLSIARHVAIDQRRRKRQMVTVADDKAWAEIADGRPGPQEAADVRELAGVVAGCIASLRPRDARAILLATHFECTPAEVAASLGVTTGAAKVAVHRARKRLRAMVAERM